MTYSKPQYNPRTDTYICEFPMGQAPCGREVQDLVRHITRSHGITVAKYKEMLGLNKSERLMSRRTQDALRQANLNKGLYNNLRPSEHAFKKGDNTIQKYKRSPQNMERLKSLHTLRKKKAPKQTLKVAPRKGII